MAAPGNIPNIGSQIDRAIVAYLASVNAGYITDDLAAQILPANSPVEKGQYTIVVHAVRGQNQPERVGNKLFNIQIRIEYSAVTEVSDPNPEGARVLLDQVVGQVAYALLQSDDGQSLNYTARAITTAGRALSNTGTAQSKANNADMANFTLQYLFDQGQTRGEPNEEGASWVEVLNFDATCIPVAVDMT